MNLSIFRDKYPRKVDKGEVYCFCDSKYMVENQKPRRAITEDFLSLFIEKNSDGTRNLRLKGNELQIRIQSRIGTIHMPLITSFMKRYPTLVKLDLSYNRIDSMGLQMIIEDYLKFPNPLEVLNLTGCDIGCNGITLLCECWPTLKLKTLKLTANKFGAKCGEDFFTLLMNCKTLEALYVDATGQDMSSFPIFMNAIRIDCGQNTTLKAMDISDIVPLSRCSQIHPNYLAEHLNTMLEMNNSLRELHLQKCCLDGHAIEIILEGLSVNKSLMLLDLGYNQIGNFGAEKIAEYFMTKPAMLQGLNLAGNSIGEIGGRALSFGLPYSRLRLLDLSQNKITDVAMCEIVLSIKKFQKMRLFYIFGNEIGPLSLEVLERQIAAGIYEQSNIDFQLFRTPEGLHVSKYTTNNYKQFVYSQLEHEDVRELRIRRNIVRGAWCKEHAKVNFEYYHADRPPPCDEIPDYEPRPEDDEKLRKRCAEKARLEEIQAEQESDASQYGVVAEESSDSCIANQDDDSLRQMMMTAKTSYHFFRYEEPKETEKDNVSEVEVFIDNTTVNPDVIVSEKKSLTSMHIVGDAIEKRLSLMLT